MVSVTVLGTDGFQGRIVAIDFGPPAGPYLCLTWQEWRSLKQWIAVNGDPR